MKGLMRKLIMNDLFTITLLLFGTFTRVTYAIFRFTMFVFTHRFLLFLYLYVLWIPPFLPTEHYPSIGTELGYLMDIVVRFKWLFRIPP